MLYPMFLVVAVTC